MSSPPSRSDNRTEAASRKTLRKGLSFFFTICVLATIGYVLAGWEWLDAIYMVTITIFGVGYGEVRPVEGTGLKIFTMGVILAGCSSLIYVIGGLVQMLAEGEIERMLGIRQRSKDIDKLHDHTIICGYGRVGQMLAAELQLQGEPLVILDCDPRRVEKATNDGFLAFEGNAVDDETLHDVGLFRAATLATVLPDDATNVFITLTARDLCESVCIIARAECPTTERKLIRGGATHVVMPAAIGAIRIAQLVSQPGAETQQLPEARYRIIQKKAESSESAPATVDSDVHGEIEELASLATGLTQLMAERRAEKVEVEVD